MDGRPIERARRRNDRGTGLIGVCPELARLTDGGQSKRKDGARSRTCPDFRVSDQVSATTTNAPNNPCNTGTVG